MASKKRFLALILAIMMVFQTFPVTAFASTAVTSNVDQGSYQQVEFIVDGEVIATQLVASGAAIIYPEDPTKDGARFTGWQLNNSGQYEATFEPIATYTVTVQYMMQNTETAVSDAVSRQYTSMDFVGLADDAVIDQIVSPASATYDQSVELVYPDKPIVDITPALLAKAVDNVVNVRVDYYSPNVEYTVYHVALDPSNPDKEAAKLTTPLRTETGYGLKNTSITPTSVSLEHYNYEAVEGVVLSTDGSTTNVAYVYYIPHQHTLTYNSQGGSYVAPKMAYHGEEVTVYETVTTEEVTGSTTTRTCGLEEHTHSSRNCYTTNCDHWFSWDHSDSCYTLTCDKEEHTHTNDCNTTTNTTTTKTSYTPTPTRTGYSFTGWYLDAACTTMVDPSIALNDNVTVYAGWEAATVKYTIVYVKEVYNNSLSKAEASFISSSTATGKVGEMTAAVGGRTIDDYHTAGVASNVVIKADGSSVATVSYPLKKYTIIFDLNDNNNATGTITMNGKEYHGTEYRLTVVLGQNINSVWPSID